MPIQQEASIPVTSVLKLILDTEEESLTIDTLGSVNTFADVSATVMKPGASELPGLTTFSLQDFEFLVTVDTTLGAGEVNIVGSEVTVAEDVLDSLTARYVVPATIEEVAGVKQFVVTLKTGVNQYPYFRFDLPLKQALLAKVGTTIDDDITSVEAFTAILEVAGV